MSLLSAVLDRLRRKPAPSLSGPPLVVAQVLERLPLAAVVIDGAGRGVFSNQAARRLAVWAKVSWSDATLHSLFSPDDHLKLAALLEKDDGPVPVEMEARIVGDDGRNLPHRVSLSRFMWGEKEGHLISLQASAPEAVKLQMALQQARKFQQISANQSSFLASMSHEIRTPLNGMLGMIDLLMFTGLTPKQQMYVSSLKKSSDNLHGQINTVLDYSKIEAGLVETERVPFDIGEVLRSVIDAFSPLASRKGLTLVLDQSLGHTRYLGDPHQIGKVLNNLISNALKFTSRGGVCVAASASAPKLKHETTRLTVSVTDTGIGVPVSQQSRIFKSFAQASPSVGRDYGGSGLGLFISEQLVTLMGGEMSVTSEPEKGSTFTFWLDLQSCVFETNGAAAAAPVFLRPLAGARILVAEDDMTNRMLLEAWLAEASAVVVCCSDGQQVLDELAKGSFFDAILMDISMPKLDGLEATRRIRRPGLQDSPERQQFLANIPIVGISGHVFTEDVARCLRAGMTSCLPKPLSRSDMLQALTSVLASYADDVQA